MAVRMSLECSLMIRQHINNKYDIMTNEIDNFIKNFEDMFKNITPAQQTEIKNITNNTTTNVNNDNLIIPQDAIPFLVNYDSEADGIQNIFGFNADNLTKLEDDEFVSFYKFKSTKQKMYITDLVLFNNIYDTTASLNVEFSYRIFVDGMPLINKKTIEYISESSATWGLNLPNAKTNAQSINSYPINFKRPLIVNENNIFDIRCASGASYSSTDTYTGSLKTAIGGYFSKVE